MDFLIPSEQILLHSTASNKRCLINDLASLLPHIDQDTAVRAIMSREKLGSTGIGDGVAIPHGRVPDLAHPVLAFARHQDGIDFDAIDDQKVHIVILMLVPDNQDKQHLQLLAHLARLLQQNTVRQKLMDAPSKEDIIQIFPALTDKAA